jgi:hypothetical protein
MSTNFYETGLCVSLDIESDTFSMSKDKPVDIPFYDMFYICAASIENWKLDDEEKDDNLKIIEKISLSGKKIQILELYLNTKDRIYIKNIFPNEILKAIKISMSKLIAFHYNISVNDHDIVRDSHNTAMNFLVEKFGKEFAVLQEEIAMPKFPAAYKRYDEIEYDRMKNKTEGNEKLTHSIDFE